MAMYGLAREAQSPYEAAETELPLLAEHVNQGSANPVHEDKRDFSLFKSNYEIASSRDGSLPQITEGSYNISATWLSVDISPGIIAIESEGVQIVTAHNVEQTIIRVVGAQGQGLTSASVVINGYNKTLSYLTDEQGRLIVELPIGHYDVSVDYKGFQNSGQLIIPSSSINTYPTSVFIEIFGQAMTFATYVQWIIVIVIVVLVLAIVIHEYYIWRRKRLPQLFGAPRVPIEVIEDMMRGKEIKQPQRIETKKPQRKKKKWDIFICHASEDIDEVARPLSQILRDKGLKVWYDEFTLTIGDKLRRKIDEGLLNSNYGVVILSHNFFVKEWPQKELDGLVALEADGTKKILPVWHNIGRDEVTKYSPTLADKFVVSTSEGLDVVVNKILELYPTKLRRKKE